jgi:hypothetical protein
MARDEVRRDDAATGAVSAVANSQRHTVAGSEKVA